MTVPLTYDEPDGETIDVEVLRLPAADPEKRLGSLVLNPGGPGGSGVEYARGARVVVRPVLLDHYDIVGFDPRGVADSTPIECLSDAQLDRFLNVDPNPETDEDIAATVAVSKRFGPRCERNSPDLTPNIGTPFVARDMDILRSLLGDERLNFLGKSYGTFIGATYADLFPSRVGRFVLDGAVDPTLTNAELSRGQALGFEKALLRFTQWCAGEEDCPTGDDPQAGVQKVADLLASIEQNPLPADTGRPLTAAQATTGIVGSLYAAEEGWQALFYSLDSAFQGDGFGLQALADWLTDRKPNGTYANNARTRRSTRSTASTGPTGSARRRPGSRPSSGARRRPSSARPWPGGTCPATTGRRPRWTSRARSPLRGRPRSWWSAPSTTRPRRMSGR